MYQCSLVRHIFNWGLARRIEVYEATKKGLTYNQQSAEMTAYKQANRWLYDAPSNSLQHALKDVERAFKNFFEKRARFPRFKSKHRTQPAIRHPNGCVLERKRIKLPKLGWVRCHNSHDHGKVKSVTVKQTPTGEWFAACVTEFVAQPVKQPSNAVGIDLGLKDFAVITDGVNYEHIAPPKWFREYEQKLAKAQRALSRKKKGSNNRAKAKLKVAKLHKRIASLRKNWLHQVTNKLVNEYDLICLEDLSIKGMAKTKLAKSVLDAALSEFVRQLEYKSAWRGKVTNKVDRFFPSSKLHAACGTINKDLTLSDRIWTCACGETINRDENAALNILLEGATGHDIPSLKLLRKGKASTTLAPSVDARIPLL
jgi:putative transposase